MFWVCAADDSRSFTIFSCHFHDILSSQASLNNEENKKNRRFWRKLNRVTIVENMSRFGTHDVVHSTLVKTCHDGYFVTRF